MKRKLHSFILVLGLLPGVLVAQRPSTKMVASPAQMQERSSYKVRQQQLINSYQDLHPLQAHPSVSVQPATLANGKVSAINPVQLGTSSNALTIQRGEQNQVAVDNATDAVAFIHRQDVSVWGGGTTENGKFRYDLSIDNGATFNNDIGTLQQVYTNYGRYPNCSFFNENGSSNPYDDKLLYFAPTNRFPAPGWVGTVNGLSDVVTSGPPTSTEHYQFDGETVLLPGGLCEGLPGEFWAVDFAFDGTNVMDSLRLYKGVYNPNLHDVDWVLYSVIDPGYDKTYDGSIGTVGPNIAFSPDGMTGYIGFVANILAGTNTNNETLMPVFIKTTDGGVTWGAPMEVDLDAIPWIADSLQTLWIDSLGNPASDGRAIAAFDFDITVDGDGNVHMADVIGTAAGGFAISSGIAKFLADITTPDGGATWEVTYMSPVLTFRGSYGTGANPITVDNFCQISRDVSGDYIYFSWVDSDTSLVTGTQNGIGFGESSNVSPNLRVCAKDLVNGTQTYPKLVTDGDLIWEGRALTPTMAPVVLETGSIHHLPIVVLDLLQNDPDLQSGFWYFGNDVTVDVTATSQFCFQPMMQLSWNHFGFPGTTPVCAVGIENEVAADAVLYNWYPNPANGAAEIQYELPAAMDISMEVVNAFGQRISTLAKGEVNAGRHVARLETSQLATGVYFCQFRAGDQFFTKKLVVTH